MSPYWNSLSNGRRQILFLKLAYGNFSLLQVDTLLVSPSLLPLSVSLSFFLHPSFSSLKWSALLDKCLQIHFYSDIWVYICISKCTHALTPVHICYDILMFWEVHTTLLLLPFVPLEPSRSLHIVLWKNEYVN